MTRHNGALKWRIIYHISSVDKFDACCVNMATSRGKSTIVIMELNTTKTSSFLGKRLEKPAFLVHQERTRRRGGFVRTIIITTHTVTTVAAVAVTGLFLRILSQKGTLQHPLGGVHGRALGRCELRRDVFPLLFQLHHRAVRLWAGRAQGMQQTQHREEKLTVQACEAIRDQLGLGDNLHQGVQVQQNVPQCRSQQKIGE